MDNFRVCALRPVGLLSDGGGLLAGVFRSYLCLRCKHEKLEPNLCHRTGSYGCFIEEVSSHGWEIPVAITILSTPGTDTHTNDGFGGVVFFVNEITA